VAFDLAGLDLLAHPLRQVHGRQQGHELLAAVAGQVILGRSWRSSTLETRARRIASARGDALIAPFMQPIECLTPYVRFISIVRRIEGPASRVRPTEWCMRRQLTVLLFLAILVASLATALVVALVMHRAMVVSADRHISGIHAQLQDRFRAFDLLLAEQETLLNKRMEVQLPLVAEALEAMAGDPRHASREQLDTLSARYDFQYLYVIDRQGRVVSTNFDLDMGLDLAGAGEGMRALLERLYGSGEVVAERFNASIQTGRLYKYAYHGPQGRDYVLEAAVDLREYLHVEVSPRMERFLFDELLGLAVTENSQVVDFDVFIASSYGGWSLLHEGRRLNSRAMGALGEAGRVVLEDGALMTVYERLPRVDADLGETDSLITQVTYDLSDQARLLWTSVGLAIVLAAGFGVLAFMLARDMIHRRLLQPVSVISDHLDNASRGEFRRMAATGVSELDVITRGVNLMLERIQDREAKLLDAQHQLERRVQERTSELESLNEKLVHLATTDPLTGLANRRSFFECAELELSRVRRTGRPAVVAMFDLDNFKQINDTHGHGAGDRILEAVSGAFVGELRDIDVVGRLGGEEFGVLLVNVSVPQAVEIVERIRQRVAACEVEVSGERLAVTVSAGVADCDPVAVGLGTALALADRALYQAKHQGRNRVVIRAPEVTP